MSLRSKRLIAEGAWEGGHRDGGGETGDRALWMEAHGGSTGGCRIGGYTARQGDRQGRRLLMGDTLYAVTATSMSPGCIRPHCSAFEPSSK